MCATYYIAVDEKEMAEIIDAVKKNAAHININTGDIYPKSVVPVFAKGEEGIYALPMMWGFPLKGKKSVSFNARSENIYRYPMYRNAKPVIIPASGFYEWKTEVDDRKQKYIFNALGEPVTFIAGLCSDFAELEDGLFPMRFTMITAPPDEMFAEYHDRKPIVLDKEECWRWLETKSKEVLFEKPVELEVRAV